MRWETFVLVVCIMTIVAHISLLHMRGCLIEQCRREQRKMRCEWEDWKAEQERWVRDFEEAHPSWMNKPSKRIA